MATITITPGWAGPLSGVGTAAIVVQVAGVGPTGPAGTSGVAPSGTGIVTVTSGTLGTPGALTGDVTTTAGGLATTLATVNSNVGSFTNASITVNAKGLVTAASSGAAGGITIGDTVTSGTAGRVLYVGTGPVLAQDAGLTYDASTDTLTAGQFVGGGAGLTGVGLTTGTLAQFAATTSAQLAGVLSDETGSGAAVFGTSPTLAGPVTITTGGSAVGLSVDATAPSADLLRLRVGGAVRAAVGSGGNRLSLGEYAGSGVQLGTGAALLIGSTNGEGDRAGFYLSHQSAGSGYGFFFFTDGNTYQDNYGNGDVYFRSGGSAKTIFRLSQTGNVSTPFEASVPAHRFRGRAGQTGHLIQCESDGSVTVASVSAAGVGTFAGLTVSGANTLTLGVFTVATLPSAASNASAFATVTDASSTTNGTTVAGGGSNRVPVFSDGTNWIIK